MGALERREAIFLRSVVCRELTQVSGGSHAVVSEGFGVVGDCLYVRLTEELGGRRRVLV